MPKISAYTAASAVTDDDIFIFNDGSTTKSVTALIAKTYFAPGATGNIITPSGTNLAALQAAVTAANSGDTVKGTPGTTYTHASYWDITKAGITLDFRGCNVVASNEASSAILLSGNNITWIGGKLSTTGATVRGGTLIDHKLVINTVSGCKIYQPIITNSKAVGVFVYGGSDFLIQDALCIDTLADTIHITAASTRGIVNSPRCFHGGDDGVAVVSYATDGSACSLIDIIDPVVWDNIGRGVSVVGGTSIRIYNPILRRTYWGGIYIAFEPTAGGPGLPSKNVDDVIVYGGTLTNCSIGSGVDQGSVFVFAGGNTPATVNNVKILGTEIIDPYTPTTVAALQLKNGGSTGIATNIVFGTTDQPVRVNGQYGSLTQVDSGLSLSGSNIISGPVTITAGDQLAGSATYNPPSLTNGTSATTTVTVTGAAVGDVVMGVGHSSIAASGWSWQANVTSANTVSVVLTNNTGGTVDLASGTLTVFVLKA